MDRQGLKTAPIGSPVRWCARTASEPASWEETLEAMVRNYPSERVESICGVPADFIREVARLYATATILYPL